MKTITQALYDAAADDRCGITILDDNDNSERLGYAEILTRALGVAARLREIGIAAGDRVPIVLPTTPTFVATFYGLVLAGAIPCPISMPAGFAGPRCLSNG